MERPDRNGFQVGHWTVEPQLNQISRGEEIRRLEPKVMAVLEALATRQGEVVTRDELLSAVWADVAVTDNVVARAVASLRKLLEDDWRRPVFIQTVSKSGYRMVARVVPRETVELPAATEREAPPSLRRPWSKPSVRRIMVAAGVFAVGVVIVLAGWSRDSVSADRSGPAAIMPTPVTALPGREMYPAISPDGRRVAFVHAAHADGDLHTQEGWDILVKGVDTEDVVQLTRDPGLHTGPAWSPDSKRIAWYRVWQGECALYVSFASGGTPFRVADCGHRIMGRLSWSADGTWLASSESKALASPRQVVLTEIATGTRKILTTPPAESRGDQYPVFSPDGARVAFTRAFPDGRGDLYVVPARGGEPRRLSFENRIVMGLDWTADAEQLVYSASYGGTPALWRLATSGGEPSPVRATDLLAYWPSLSRTDDQLVYSRYDDDTNIYAVHADEGFQWSAAELVAGSTRQDLQPQISPDGTRLAFVSNRSGSFEIYTSNLDGTGVRRNTRLEGPTVAMPSWSPDSRSVVFHAHGQDGIALYVVEADGRSPRRLTAAGAIALNPSWSVNGEWIYFASDRSGDWQIWKVDLDGEKTHQVTRQGGLRGMEDPSGKSLIYFKHDQPGIWQLPLTVGPERLLLSEMTLSEFGHWTVTDSGVWLVRRGAEAGLAFYDFDQQTTTTHYRPAKPVPYTPNTLAVSPDGKTVVFVQVERSESDIVLLKRSDWTR